MTPSPMGTAEFSPLERSAANRFPDFLFVIPSAGGASLPESKDPAAAPISHQITTALATRHVKAATSKNVRTT